MKQIERNRKQKMHGMLLLKKIYSLFLTKEINCKKWCFLTAGTALGIICAAALTAFIVDPYYRYRKPFFYDIVYYKVYATAPQLLRTEDYNLLMLGTSMVRNFFLDDINRTFNCNAIKLAASGGTMQDLKLFFDIAANAKGN